MEKQTKTKKTRATKKVSTEKVEKKAVSALSSKVYNQSGKEVGEVKLPANIFGLNWNADLVHQVTYSMLSNARTIYAHTKGRGEVSGGGKKPWKQKGTGRARHGSVRAPVFVGGGIVFGPQPRDYTLQFPQSMKQAAAKSAFALKLKEGKIVVMDNAKMAKPATKTVAAAFAGIGATRSVMFVVDDMHTDVVKSARNISFVTIVPAKNVTTYDVYTSHTVVLTKEAVKQLEQRFA